MAGRLNRETLYSVFVGSLPENTTQRDVSDIFSRCGLIQDLWISFYKDKNEKYGFVRYASPQEAYKAVEMLHRSVLHKAHIIVDYSSDTLDRMKSYQDSLKKKDNDVPFSVSKNKQNVIDEGVKKATLSKAKVETNSRDSAETDSKDQATIVLKVVDTKLKTKRAEPFTYTDKSKTFSVYVGHLPQDTTTKEMKDVFSEFGDVVDVFVNTYEDTGNKYGFVRFSNVKSVLQAVEQLNGTKLKGQVIQVQFAHDTVDRLQGASFRMQPKFPVKDFVVYVGRIHPDVTKKELADLFTGCGPIHRIHINNNDLEERFGFIHFSTFEAASDAVRQLHGWKLKDRFLLVDFSHGTAMQIPRGHLSNVVPILDPSKTCASSKSKARSPEVETIIRRSQVQEAYCSLSSKFVFPKGSGMYKSITDIDGYSSKVPASKPSLSPRCSLTVNILSDQLEKKANRWASMLFMDKFDDVMNDVEKLLAKAMKQVESPPKASHCTAKPPSSSITSPLKNQSVRKRLEPHFQGISNDENKVSSGSNKLHTVAVSCDKQTCRPSLPCDIPCINSLNAEVKSPISLIDRGRRLKQQLVNKTDVELNYHKLITERKRIEKEREYSSQHSDKQNDRTQDCVEERLQKGSAQQSLNPQIEAEEGWDEVSSSSLPHMAWASELFCQLLDAEQASESDSSPSLYSCDSGSSSGYSTCDKGMDGNSSPIDHLQLKSKLKIKVDKSVHGNDFDWQKKMLKV